MVLKVPTVSKLGNLLLGDVDLSGDTPESQQAVAVSSALSASIPRYHNTVLVLPVTTYT